MARWPRRPRAPIVGAALLAGCVVGLDYRTPDLPIPANWSGEKPTKSVQPAQLSQWWQRLRDPQLDSLVEEAVAGNLDVATAKAKIREARADYRQSAGTLFPSADGSASATRNRTAAAAAGGTASDAYSQYQSGFAASWELDLFGANRRGVEAARHGVDASQEELRSTLLTLVGDVASTYTQARGYQARIALARRSAVSQRQTAELTRTMAQAGSAMAASFASDAGVQSSLAGGQLQKLSTRGDLQLAVDVVHMDFQRAFRDADIERDPPVWLVRGNEPGNLHFPSGQP